MFRLVVTLVFFGVCNSVASPTLSEDRIVNGKSASINDFPFQVSIQEDGGHFCGGSIIDRKYVLTAAHCFEDTDLSKVKNMQIRAGSSQWASGGVVKSVKAWHMHPGWNNNTMDNDICILELTSALVPSASIREIPLATVTPSDGTIVTASGWGTTIEGGQTFPNLLQKTELAFLTTKACGSQKYGYTKANILDMMVCAVGAATDSCQGDSGGPLVANDGKLVGVVSWGQGCGRKGYPGVYADVAKFVPWIKETLKKLST